MNVTKNYTVEGNWTRTVTNSVTIAGLGQPTDSVISPDGKFLYVITGYFTNSMTYGGLSSCGSTEALNYCSTNKGYITTFARDSTDGSLLWSSTLSLGSVNLVKMKMTTDGKFIYVVEYDSGIVSFCLI